MYFMSLYAKVELTSAGKKRAKNTRSLVRVQERRPRAKKEIKIRYTNNENKYKCRRINRNKIATIDERLFLKLYGEFSFFRITRGISIY